MIRDCLKPYYTPQEYATIQKYQAAYFAGKMNANKAILKYIEEHPPTNGTTVLIPGQYINEVFAEYNEAVTAWMDARRPVITRYAKGKTDSDLIQDAKLILRGIRWKDIKYHPFSKRGLAKTDRFHDMVGILALILTPQIQALKDKYNEDPGNPAFDDTMQTIFETIYRKAGRINENLKKKEGAANNEQDN